MSEAKPKPQDGDPGPTSREVGAARAYERLLVPAVFQGWTSVVLDAADVASGDRVLDVACGTGVLARAAVQRTSPAGRVTGLDLNTAMLSVASAIEPNIEWREGRAEALPFPDQSFDAVVSQFGLMFFEDKTAAMKEIGRVTTKAGRAGLAVFDSVESAPGYEAVANAFEKIAGPEIAAAVRSPFSLYDRSILSGLLHQAGFDSTSITRLTGTTRFPHAREMVLADVLGWFPLAGLTLDGEALEAVIAQAQEELRAFTSRDGSVEFPTAVLMLAGSKR